MFLSRWLTRLGHLGRRARRISITKRYCRPTLEALETREVPTVSFGASFWAPPPQITALLSQMAATPFGASSDGERPLTRLQALTQAANHSGPSVFVHDGQSIQAAINTALPGTTIYIDPGIYHEALDVHTADIHLVGLVGAYDSHAVLVNPGTNGDGVHVGDQGDGFAMRFIEVRGFQGDGIHLDHVDDFRLTHLLLSNDSSGIAAVNSSHGTIQYTEESGGSTAGVDLQASNDVMVRYNRSHGNVVGIEVVNSSHVQVVRNVVFDNTAGIVAALMPGGTETNDLIAENYVVANNHVNFAAAGSAESKFVQGTGVELIGADKTTVRDNLIMSNQTMGIGVFSGPDSTADNNTISSNWVLGNGFHSMSPLLPQGGDLLSDGLGNGNHWKKNTFGTARVAALPV